MLCKKPISVQGGYYPCGQCMPCRINRRRLWTHRLMLEASLHGDNSFITLTYDEDHCPDELKPEDVRNWLKRFRKRVASEYSLRVRFYLVGEYGEHTQRPHYHVAMFGYPRCDRGLTNFSRRTGSCCTWCDTVSQTWGKGSIQVAELNDNSAQYIVGYVLKKMTAPNDPRLLGRYPEFARMSRRPGIGAGMVEYIAETLQRFNLDHSQTDVPSSLRHGAYNRPLGRYMRRKIRVALGLHPNMPQAELDRINEEMLALQEAAINSPEFVSVRDLLIQKDAKKIASMEAKAKIYKKRDSI